VTFSKKRANQPKAHPITQYPGVLREEWDSRFWCLPQTGERPGGK
jgi:hypothetical protein